MKEIPFVMPLLPSIESYKEQIQDIWDNRYLTNCGPKVQLFEKKLKEYLHIDNVACFVNGHLSLDCAIKALKLKGEVITTPFTFVSTIQALVTNQITPVFCDINRYDFTIDTDKIEELITENTTAILGVHVFGYPCSVEKLKEIADKHHLKLLFDGAHAFGAETEGKALLDQGDISMVSFHATKIFHSIEGGALIFKDAELLHKFRAIHNFGYDNGNVSFCGTNAKMNEFSAVMGLLNLDLVEDEIANRKRVADQYRELLADVPGVEFQKTPNALSRENNAYFPILLDEKTYGADAGALYQSLFRHGIVSRRYFYPACNEMDFLKEIGTDPGDTPVAARISRNILCLPIYGSLSTAEIEYICAQIRRRD